MQSSKVMKAKSDRNLVEIKFYDPTEFDTRFDSEAVPLECSTVGWVLRSDKETLKLAWIIDGCKEGDFAGLVIPRGCVKEIRSVT